ncbi:MAG: hypothetical protein JWR77_2666 [Rhizorhabdus sp.]|nr:hypothetical protein [Rhizorhabdus sp.]
MARIRGWTVWAKSGERLRQFTVAETSEGEALATFKQAHPDLEVVSRQAMSLELMHCFGAKARSVTEWKRIDPKKRITRAGGTSIETSMGR